MSRNKIIPQMFDIRPVDETGDLDWQKIQEVANAHQCVGDDPYGRSPVSELKSENQTAEHFPADYTQEWQPAAFRDHEFSSELALENESLLSWQPPMETVEEKEAQKARKNLRAAFSSETRGVRKNKNNRNSTHDFSWRDLFSLPRLPLKMNLRQASFSFVALALVLSLGIGSLSFASRSFGLKGKVLGASQDGYANLTAAIGGLASQNFESSSDNFAKALDNFSSASANINDMGGILLDATRYVPFASKISSGKNAVEAGKHFSAAGQSLNEVVKIFSALKNPVGQGAQDVSLLDVLKASEKNIALAKNELDAAQENLDRISVDDLPEDKQGKFLLLKENLPTIRSAMDMFLGNSHIFSELLGGNGPRKYLFLFQNNSEMRATGGFIGSYGLLDITNGHVRKFFIDGIFNPDGQLKDKVVPPTPIQKISAAWSLHDSNWFADFPTSAQKAVEFYENTGGPTADGVIALTPTVMQKLLEITGPIEMPDYDVTLDAENFVEKTQYEVEVDYDKEENQPKKILADLAPLILEKLLQSHDPVAISKTVEALLSGLREKHILLYSQDAQIEDIISKQGWSGEILEAPKDYISVINTNINGFKTDAVVDESIKHSAQIQEDGSIIDTVTIERKHNGGDLEYDWFNKVNADYMRVYVPEGSKLLEVSGQTRETDASPLDYDALSFKRDADVEKEEKSAVVDSASGTRIYNEDGKTVFANWTYVSPKETMRITYKYLLPFHLFQLTVGDGEQTDSYSLVAQKQSGSVGSSFSSNVSYPSAYKTKWKFPSDAVDRNGEIKTDAKLDTDRFVGAVFEK